MTSTLSAKEGAQLLYERYSNDVYRYAKHTLGDQNEAYEVVQEVFIRTFKSWDSFRHESGMKTWVMSITKNYLTDVLRKRNRDRQFRSTQELSEVNLPIQPVEPFEEVEVILSCLKAHYRQVVHLRYIEGFSIRETAEILTWSESKVKNACHRAIRDLQSSLNPNYLEVRGSEIGASHD